MKKILIILTIISLTIVSCDEEFLDPTKPSQDDVFSSRLGVIGAANGLQSRWSVGGLSPLHQSTIANGCCTREITFKGGAGNVNEIALEDGRNSITSTNTTVNNLWSQSLIVKSESEKVLKSLNLLIDPVEKASVLAHASIFRALALTTLAQFYQKVPLLTEKNANFNNRSEIINESINTLLATLPSINNANGFTGLIGTVKYKSTVYALLARNYLMLGKYIDAIDNANLVNLTVKSTYAYDPSALNSLFVAGTSSTAAAGFKPTDRNFGLIPALVPVATDGRKSFYFNAITATELNFLGFIDTNVKLIPVYLPSEMILIKAEAHARLNQLNLATDELNKIITKTIANDVFGIGANLSAYSGSNTQDDILIEIYKNRCIELYLSGLKFEDSKRFGRPYLTVANTPFDHNREYLPYPDSERFNNPNTPPDPAN